MSEYVEVPFEGKAEVKATLLLAAAEELGLGQGVVQTRTGAFYVPAEVNEKAFASREEVSDGNSEGDEEKPKRAPRKSTASKKAQE